MIPQLTKFSKQIKKARQELKYNRKRYWQKNKDNFLNNLKTLVSFFPQPEGWRISIVASYFLLEKEGKSMPFDDDVWSFVDIVGATKNQGHDIIVFFNRADLEFLSTPALLPLVVHEMKHVEQAAKDPKNYIETGVNDALNKSLEIEAEAEVIKYSDEYRKQNVMEKILYSYDKKSWKGAKKMAHYLFAESETAFGGGYNQDMKKEEYDAFIKAEEEKDIDIFIDYFINTYIEEKKEKVEEKPDKDKEKTELKKETEDKKEQKSEKVETKSDTKVEIKENKEKPEIKIKEEKVEVK